MNATAPRSFLHSLPTQEHLGTKGSELSSCFLSGQKSGQNSGQFEGRMTPERRSLEPDPGKWMRFLHATCRNYLEAQVLYEVSEKTARKWWEGVGACRGDKIIRAVELNPIEANVILFDGAYAIAAE